ncbi:MAG: ABC transporter substrate-binding protein [Proteobacteria bacterium]|nr:ABC transporter substrate-binding protein [Pseudomonadota bacterium]MBI3499053.1 ABC transporter substrate-binding protein [Pseudomonadota bacterium]
MRRREFITVAAAGTLARPRVGLAQQAVPAQRIGVFIPFAESDRTQQQYYLGFKEKLRHLGWVEGRTVEFIERWRPGASIADFQSTAAELVNQGPDLIFLVSTPALKAVAAATGLIPIVFVGVSDPVGQGLISNLARPGRNLTGFTFFDPEMGGKWLGLLKEMAPRVVRVRVVFNPNTAPQAKLFLDSIEAAAASFGVVANAAPVHDAAEIEATLGALEREANGGLFFPSDTFTINHRALVLGLTTRYRLPALYAHDFFTREGGLASYSVAVAAQYVQAAEYADVILKGAFAGDLPVQQPTKFELVINLKTAKALGLGVPQSLLALADEVIE